MTLHSKFDVPDNGYCGQQKPLDHLELRPVSPIFPQHIQVRCEKPALNEALQVVREAIKSSPSYAWQWHCDIAMKIWDHTHDGVLSNTIASNIMHKLFGIETRYPKDSSAESTK